MKMKEKTWMDHTEESQAAPKFAQFMAFFGQVGNSRADSKFAQFMAFLGSVGNSGVDLLWIHTL